MELLIEIMGWVASVLFIGAYFLLSNKKIKDDSYVYQGMNILGSSLMLIHFYVKSTIPGMALELVWASIGIYALWKYKWSKS